MQTLANEAPVVAAPPAGARRSAEPPLVVDLDGTLIRTDLLVESFVSLVATRPLAAFAALGALRHGRAALKGRLADEAVIEFHTLPFNEEVVRFLAAERAAGRRIYLASAADRRFVAELADQLGVFDGVFASDGAVNLAGEAKAEALCRAFGERGFDYVGNAAVDEAVWRRARGVIVATRSASLLRKVRAFAPDAMTIAVEGGAWHDYVRALRVHQWLKNMLLLVPAIAAHDFGGALVAAILAFVSFSLCASGVYIVNDLIDLSSDRGHSRKRERPFAAGRIPIVHGALLIPGLFVGSLAIALVLPWTFLAVLVGYAALTFAYTFALKRHVLVDVVTLACLYGARIVAGSAASQIDFSPWLTAFAIFLFFCLALVKRCTELDDCLRQDKPNPRGRGYRVADLPVLQSLSGASGYVAVLVLALYFNSEAVRELYTHPERLWFICVFMLFWVSRTILLAHRGDMHDDPVVFAATDRVSLLVGLGCAAVAAASF